MPFDVNVNSIETALEVMDGVDNTGVVIDTWHMGKLGIKPDDLRKIPLDRLGWVELSDGQYEDMEDQLDEVVNRRKLPGEGEFDIRGYVEVCRDMGYAEPWGVEVLSEDLRALPMDEMFRRSYDDGRGPVRAGRRLGRCPTLDWEEALAPPPHDVADPPLRGARRAAQARATRCTA